MTKTKQITFRLSESELAYIEQAASENGLTISGLLRFLIAQYRKKGIS